jgi:hypothetical protein
MSRIGPKETARDESGSSLEDSEALPIGDGGL